MLTFSNNTKRLGRYTKYNFPEILEFLLHEELWVILQPSCNSWSKRLSTVMLRIRRNRPEETDCLLKSPMLYYT